MFFFYDDENHLHGSSLSNSEFDEQLQALRKRVKNKEKNINTTIKLFEDKRVRTAWNEDEGEWYFSIIDVIAILTDSSNPRNYWNMLKSRLNQEGNETYTNCVQLKMPATDGKMRLTDVANTEQLLRIIQSIPSPKAEPRSFLFFSLYTILSTSTKS